MRIQPPFSQEECKELTRLNGAGFILHCLAISDSSFPDPGQESGHSYMCMVARILIRVGTFHFLHRLQGIPVLSCTLHAVHWRQVHFRPHRPLPRNISHIHTAKHTPILRMVLEIVASTLCFGILFLFVDRTRYSI